MKASFKNPLQWFKINVQFDSVADRHAHSYRFARELRKVCPAVYYHGWTGNPLTTSFVAQHRNIATLQLARHAIPVALRLTAEISIAYPCIGHPLNAATFELAMTIMDGMPPEEAGLGTSRCKNISHVLQGFFSMLHIDPLDQVILGLEAVVKANGRVNAELTRYRTEAAKAGSRKRKNQS